MSASPKPKSKVITTTDAEYEKRDRRKSSYHLVASKNKLPNEPGDLEDDPLYEYLLSTSAEWGVSSGSCNPKVQDLKRRLILELARSDGDPETPEFQAVLNELTSAEDPATSFDARKKPKKESKCCGLEGMWINLSKPKYPNCLGKTRKTGDLVYSLGRMSFNTFSPSDLICSISGTFNPVHVIKDPIKVLGKAGIPDSLLEEIDEGHTLVRSYQIVTAFCIEPYDSDLSSMATACSGAPEKSPNRAVRHRIEGLLTTDGYVVPSPYQPNRLSIWFTGGSMEVQRTAEGSNELYEWMQVFADSIAPRVIHGSCSDSVESTRSRASSRGSVVSSAVTAATSAPDTQQKPVPLRQASLRDILVGREGGFRDRTFGSRSPRIQRRVVSPPGSPSPEATRHADRHQSKVPVVMEPDGRMSYRLPNPIGGHDTAYVDVLYLDETLRIVQANTGTLHVMARVPYFADE